MRNFHARHFPRARVPLALLALSLLTHCATSSPPPESKPAATAPAPGAPPPAAANVYRVDPAHSLLQVLVYRGGRLAALGHNHVVASHDLTGTVAIGDPLTATRFDIGFPVATLTVDEPGLRRLAGADFAAEVPQAARDGTRRNMLSAALLDAERFDGIRLRVADIVAAPDGHFDVGIDVEVKGQTHRLRAPVQLRLTGDQLTARGEFALLQSDLGLTPFTALLGALAVENRMVVRFDLIAQRP